MKVILCGGGTGGHITPLLAVAKELKRRSSNHRVTYIGEKNARFARLLEGETGIDETYQISAGKFRRYHNQSWLTRLFDIKTNLLNVRDLFRLMYGFCQSLWLLRRIDPDVIFIKGGFVGVPVGLAAALLKVPYITHDSDVRGGLANRLIARWAVAHAVGLPGGQYAYKPSKTHYVGIPLSPHYAPVTAAGQLNSRERLGLPAKGRVVLVTGGSLGAQRLNKFVEKIVPRLLDSYPDLTLIHQAGKQAPNLYSELPANLKSRVKTFEFTDELYRYSAAADIVVTRGGATALAELAAQGKAAVVVPNPDLTGGHQLENAERLAQLGAAVVVTEAAVAAGETALFDAITELLDKPSLRQELSTKIAQLAKHDAVAELGKLIDSFAMQGNGK